MKKIVVVPLVILAATCAALAQDAPRNRWNFGLGMRRLGGEWGGAQDQLSIALLDYEHQFGRNGVALVVDLGFSYSPAVPRVAVEHGWTDDEHGSGSYELAIGVRKLFGRPGGLRPFVSIGGALAAASVHGYYGWYYGGYGNDDWEGGHAFAPWVDAGLYFPTHTRYAWGVRARWSDAQVTLWNQRMSAAGPELTVFAGWGW